MKTGVFWFEYHCWEDPKSGDADLWYRSHQQVEVVRLVDGDLSIPEQERYEEGMQATYEVKFADGHQGHVFEDELLESKDEFYRPHPPRPMFYVRSSIHNLKRRPKK